MANYSSLKNASILATPVANAALGSPTATYGNIYLADNAQIKLGNTTFSAANIFPFNLTIAPEVLTIQVAATDPGDDITWFWTWETSTLPYARSAITNSPQTSVPMYKQGIYTVNNFAANQTFGNMTQTHHGYFKWIDGYGTQNLVSWAVEGANVNVTHPSINGGASTSVERITVSVPSVITLPTLTQPSGISYNVSFVNTGAYTIGGAAQGNNKGIGPLYRGSTYTFNLASSIASHPFYLTTDNGTSFVSGQYVGEYTSGVTGSRNNGSTGQTTLTFTVPNNAPDVLYYQCGIHSMMRGTITIKDLAVETNINGNYVIYFQHTDEGHKTPIEIRPIPSLVNQMCVVYDASVGKFVPQDLATYVENTPSFKNKIREVAGTATLVAADGVAVVPTVAIVEDPTYLPLVNNKVGDISYSASNDTIYLWNGTAWKTKTNTVKKYITLNQGGTITVPTTGVARCYVPSALTIVNVYASLGTASSTTFTFKLLKNGTIVGTYTISSNSYKMTVTAASISLTTSDYLTLDVTGGAGASDLKVDLEYNITL
jgi:plastocyanin